MSAEDIVGDAAGAMGSDRFVEISYDDVIPNNVALGSDKQLQRALEGWRPKYLDWWTGMGPVGFQQSEVYLRTAVGVDPAGWAKFGYVKMPTYRWGILLAPKIEGRTIPFGRHKGEPAWQEVPGEHRARHDLPRRRIHQGREEHHEPLRDAARGARSFQQDLRRSLCPALVARASRIRRPERMAGVHASVGRDATAMNAGPRDSRWDADSSVRRIVLFGTAAIVIFLVVVPLIFLVYGSVNTGLPGEPGSYSLQRFSEVLTEWRTYRLLGTSVVYAAGSTVVAFVIGGALCWFVQRTDLPAKGAFMFFALFPLFLPPVLLSVAWTLSSSRRSDLLNVLVKWLFGAGPIFNINSLPGMIWVGGMLEGSARVPVAMARVGGDGRDARGGRRDVQGPPLRMIRPSRCRSCCRDRRRSSSIGFVLSIEDVTVPIVIGLPSHIT